MNNTLLALKTKLSWQLNEMHQRISQIEKQCLDLQQQLLFMQEKIHNACSLPAVLVPEQEIARLNFIIHQQQQYDVLVKEKKDYEALLLQWQERQILLNRKFKMLENYQEKQKTSFNTKTLQNQQKEMDELILQKRKSQ